MALKSRKVMGLDAHGHQYVVIQRLDTDRNPFALYELEWKQNEEGFLKRSRKLLVKYQDFDSVMFHLLQLWGYRFP